jgi:hypothetical protein
MEEKNIPYIERRSKEEKNISWITYLSVFPNRKERRSKSFI